MPNKSVPRPDFGLLDSFWNEAVHREVLANGTTVLVRPDFGAPVTSVQVWVKTGSIHEMDLLGSGVSHFVEHMLFKGTSKREGRAISRTVQGHGGYINAYTTFDRTVYYVDLPSEHMAVAVDLLADTVLNSTFPEEEFVKERDVILREIDMGQDDPDHRMGQNLFETAFRSHPYRYPIIGYKEVFSSLTRDDLVRYYRERYVPNNLIVVVAGAVEVVDVMREVEATFGKAARRRLAPSVIAGEPEQLARRDSHRVEDVEITRGGLAWPLPGITHPDAPVLDMLALMLGGGDSSRLWQSVREKRNLVHTIDAHSWTPGSAGLFYISYTCEPAKREGAEKAILAEVERVKKLGFTPAEIAKAQRQMIVGEINSRKTISGQAGRLGVAEVVAGDLGFSRTYFSRLKAIRKEDLIRVARHYLQEHRLSSLSASPRPTIEVPVTSGSVSSALQPFRLHTLPNGLRILLQQNPGLPNVHFRMVGLGGGAYEEAGKRGATALLATLLTKDTAKRSAADVAQAIEAVGGAFYPVSGNNSIGLAAEVLPGDIDLALELMGDAIAAPAFKPAVISTERSAQLASLQQDRDDVVTFARKRVRELFFGAHPLALDSAGDPGSVESLDAAALRRLWKKCFVAGNLVLSVCGAFDEKKLLAKLRPWGARIPKGKLEAVPAPWGGSASAGDKVEFQPREQAVVLQAYPGPGVKSADFHVGEVADELFSGMSSRLFERVREEKGMAYFVRSSRIIGMDTGMFSFLAGTSPAQADAVVAEINAEIERVRAGDVAADELQRCQVRLKAGRKMGLQTNASRAMQAALNTLYGFPPEEWLRYDEQIDAVTIADLRDFARRYFRKELSTQLVVRPEPAK